MVRLSVNVNKVATLRNSRGGNEPDLLQAVRVVLAAGGRGITVHPRADERHVSKSDVRALGDLLAPLREEIEFNIEGDPRPDFLELVHEVRPHQCTLVPVVPGEITSQAGFSDENTDADFARHIAELRRAGVRVSLFVDAELAAVRFAKSKGADRVELYTEPYARAFAEGPVVAERSFAAFRRAAEEAHALGLGVNAGHDLALDNLTLFARLPHLEEVSIGHALISHALYVGLERAVRDYLGVLTSAES